MWYSQTVQTVAQTNDRPFIENLKNFQPPFDNKIEHLREIVRNFEIGQIFLTALELDVFSLLQTPRRGAGVAEKLGTRADLTLKFLDLLTGMHLLTKSGDHYCTAHDVAPFLDKRSPYFARYLQLKTSERSALMEMKDIIRTGPRNPSEPKTHRFDRDAIEWMARTSLLWRLQATIGHVTNLPEFSHARRVIDLGCGHGLFGIALAQENSQLQVVLFDKPEITPIARTYIDRYGLRERVRVMSGDFTKDDIGEDYVFLIWELKKSSLRKDPGFHTNQCGNISTPLAIRAPRGKDNRHVALLF